jgi:hypothetical protein
LGLDSEILISAVIQSVWFPLLDTQRTTMVSTTWASWCLNFSLGPCLNLPFSMTPPSGHLPLRHCGSLFPDSLLAIFLCFQVPRIF